MFVCSLVFLYLLTLLHSCAICSSIGKIQKTPHHPFIHFTRWPGVPGHLNSLFLSGLSTWRETLTHRSFQNFLNKSLCQIYSYASDLQNMQLDKLLLWLTALCPHGLESGWGMAGIQGSHSYSSICSAILQNSPATPVLWVSFMVRTGIRALERYHNVAEVQMKLLIF